MYIFLAILISFLWGIQAVINKHLLEKFNQITIMFVSSLIYCFLIIILAITNSKRVLSDINKFTYTDMLTVIALSVFTIFMANMIYYYILKNHDSSIISALIYSSPVFTLIIAHLFLKERLDIYGVSGIFAIIIGVILISQNKSIYMKSGKN